MEGRRIVWNNAGPLNKAVKKSQKRGLPLLRMLPKKKKINQS